MTATVFRYRIPWCLTLIITVIRNTTFNTFSSNLLVLHAPVFTQCWHKLATWATWWSFAYIPTARVCMCVGVSHLSLSRFFFFFPYVPIIWPSERDTQTHLLPSALAYVHKYEFTRMHMRAHTSTCSPCSVTDAYSRYRHRLSKLDKWVRAHAKPMRHDQSMRAIHKGK